ncbi:hypothetical protein KXR53_16510 [Inquilinus limosus]|uniref:hypothetical protein n=1 Tax=Inquilinus limosus TaxID=171674 RepID=UPI003F17BF53
MADTLDEKEVWELLRRIREALHEFLPEDTLPEQAQTPDEEVDEIIKEIRILGQGVADKI